MGKKYCPFMMAGFIANPNGRSDDCQCLQDECQLWWDNDCTFNWIGGALLEKNKRGENGNL